MYRFDNILFSPLARHNNPAAVRRVTELAEANDADLMHLAVVAEPTRLQRLFELPGFVEEVIEAEQARLETVLHRLAVRDQDRIEVLVGDPTKAIIEHVKADGHDLVVVTSDEDRRDRTTIRRLLRTCPCPVWVIRPTRARTQRILACINPDPSEFELNKTILELASSMVQLHGGELHVMHAWQLYGEQTMRNSGFVRTSPADIATLLAAEQQRSEKAVESVIDAVLDPGQAIEIHLLKGAPEDLVPELVTKKRINLVVMGTAGRSGMAAMIMGNTAERIIDEIGCSLIAVKPPTVKPPTDEDQIAAVTTA